MKKIKLFIASFIGAIALVFAFGFSSVNAASTQPYVNAVFSSITQDKDGNDISASFSGEKTISVNGFDFKTAGSGTMLSGNGNGFKMNGSDNKITFTTLDTAKITVVFYIDKDNGNKEAAVSNDDSTNPISITGLMKSSTVAETTVSGDYKYSVTNSNSGKDVSVNIFAGPAAKYTVANSKATTIYIKSIKIQPYASVTYNMNGGSALPASAPTTVLYGDTFTPSTETTKDGYTFTGWYTNAGLTDAYDSTAPVLDNVTLYAKWADNNAVYDVTFMNGENQYGDAISIGYDSNGDATIGNSMPSNPSKWGYSFAGWYTKDGTNDDWGTQVTNSTTISSTMVTNNEITLYAKYTNGVIDPSILSLSYIDVGAAEKGTTAFNGSLPNTIYSVANCSFESDSRTIGSIGTSKNDLRTGGRMVANNETECSNNYIAINASKPGKLSIYARSTSSTARTFGVYKSTDLSTNLVSDVSVPNSVTNLEFDITEAGDYYFGGVEGGIRVYYVSFKSISDDVTLSFDAQYNGATDAASTKLRFIGTIEGIAYADYANITSMQFTFTFNGSNRVCTVSRLYKSINSNGETLYAADTTNGKMMYVVYQLTNINREAYKGETLTNCKFTLTFSDGSTKYVEHANITLPQFTTVINED